MPTGWTGMVPIPPVAALTVVKSRCMNWRPGSQIRLLLNAERERAGLCTVCRPGFQGGDPLSARSSDSADQPARTSGPNPAAMTPGAACHQCQRGSNLELSLLSPFKPAFSPLSHIPRYPGDFWASLFLVFPIINLVNPRVSQIWRHRPRPRPSQPW